MKKVVRNNETFVIGTGREIKSLYNNINKTMWFPHFWGEPKLNMDKHYAVHYYNDGTCFEDEFCIIGSDTALSMLYLLD